MSIESKKRRHAKRRASRLNIINVNGPCRNYIGGELVATLPTIDRYDSNTAYIY